MTFTDDVRDELISTVRRFVREKCIPLESQVAEEDSIPPRIIEMMKELGLFGLSVPEQYGGLGLDMMTEVQVGFELGRTSPAFRSYAGTNIGIGSQALVLFGTEEQKNKWLPGIASGDLIASFALTEPNAGSDAASVATSAKLDGDCYVLNGSKRYITNANMADLFTVMARTDETKSGAAGVSTFVVEKNSEGVDIGKPERKMGQQGAQICDVYFNEVKVPVSNRIGREGEGFKVAMSVLDKGRLHISSICTGMAERLISEMVAYATERNQFGKPIAEHQLIQAMLADSQAEAYAARSMILDAAKRRDSGEKVTMLASCCKMYASEMVGRVADRAVQVFGGAGYVADYGIERFYRDARLFRLYEGTTQIQQIIIARELCKASIRGDLQ